MNPRSPFVVSVLDCVGWIGVLVSILSIVAWIFLGSYFVNLVPANAPIMENNPYLKTILLLLSDPVANPLIFGLIGLLASFFILAAGVLLIGLGTAIEKLNAMDRNLLLIERRS